MSLRKAYCRLAALMNSHRSSPDGLELLSGTHVCDACNVINPINHRASTYCYTFFQDIKERNVREILYTQTASLKK